MQYIDIFVARTIFHLKFCELFIHLSTKIDYIRTFTSKENIILWIPLKNLSILSIFIE